MRKKMGVSDNSCVPPGAPASATGGDHLHAALHQPRQVHPNSAFPWVTNQLLIA